MRQGKPVRQFGLQGGGDSGLREPAWELRRARAVQGDGPFAGPRGRHQMAARQSKAQKETVARVMHEYKQGELERGQGGKVRNPKQAIAIALSEAGASNQQSPKENRKKLRETKRKEREGRTAQAQKEGMSQLDDTTRAELYRRAQKAQIPGRSHMDKAALQRALREHQA
ncbi:DUF6496 domain-containing protein [Roseomonas sp. E05]|uniref:DUF6496 domain-containing protein n=1 Tax=Roseomonas sp. E05 TaxID=3046310 RepID=UPI0024B9EF29|nr:DUF6496 domain-containing protein [Roseomonas sp. E05]MDJ0391084.1 DUF6496 domain-containing protein [Roseomonas sp. E05]